jgi:hypothetical protein
VRGTCSVELLIAATVIVGLAATPATASYPGSTQPGAQPVPLGNLLIIRVVPPRNAIIPGAGRAISVPTAPPSSVFQSLEGVGAPLSDGQAALVTGSLGVSQSGKIVAANLDGLLGAQGVEGGRALDPTGASRMGGALGGAIQTGVGALQGALGSLQGAGY